MTKKRTRARAAVVRPVRQARTRAAAPLVLSGLVADPENRRRHGERNLAMLTEALQRVGAARSIVIDEGNTVLAGNGVLEAALAAGLSRVRVVEADGSEVVAVRRRGLSPEQKRALALYDNRVAELATWAPAQLEADVAAGLELQPYFTDRELAALIGAPASKAGATDPDVVPEARGTTITRGQVFQLGAHRLMCGDSTRGADVGALLEGAVPEMMVTDPPYGQVHDPAWRTWNTNPGKKGTFENEGRSDWSEAWALFAGAVAYVWHGHLHGGIFQASLEATGFRVRTQIIWVKDRLVFLRGDYHSQHEPCWYAVREGGPSRRSVDRSQSSVWEIAARDDSGHGHGTQKPVECMERPIRNHDPMAVYDPFVGSGTTLIAAERQGRACYALEIMPKYVQVAIDRWEAYTGQVAVKRGEVAVG